MGGTTRKTEQCGNCPRIRESTPLAQPTETEPEKPPKTDKKERQELEAEEPKMREPEKLTEGKEQIKDDKQTIVND